MKHIPLILLIIFAMSCSIKDNECFVEVKDSIFVRNNKPYEIVGANVWYAANIASEDIDGNRDRLLKDLDSLCSMGVNNLRIQICSEGSVENKYALTNSLQPKPGVFNENLLVGLDFLLSKMKERNMTAVLVLNNYWTWSGGMCKYIEWSTKDTIPYLEESKNFKQYCSFVNRFYTDEVSQKMYRNTIETIITRKNSITGKKYTEDPTIMSWQLANEPRSGEGDANQIVLEKWFDANIKYIKSIDPKHLVSTGSEGNKSHQNCLEYWEKAHTNPLIDYLTIHIWPQNWSWFDPLKSDSTFIKAIDSTGIYISQHAEIALKLNKPLVIEEFGLARENEDLSPTSSTQLRDKYYAYIFNTIVSLKSNNYPMSGANFWAYAGNARPNELRTKWQPGDDFLGDPPHEPQGWYSVFSSDVSTINVIKTFKNNLDSIK